MYAALYYPHTEVKSEHLIKRALLTWDRLETVVPYPEYVPQYEGNIAKAMEIIGGKRSPTDAEKGAIHELVEDLIEAGVPETFTYQPEHYDQRYEMWPQKLAPKTWQLLECRRLIGGPLVNSDFPASQGAGLTLMSIIADVLGGDTRTRVTDQGAAYATIANAPRPAAGTAHAAGLEQVIPLTFKSIALENVSIERLIDFRKRETNPGNAHDYRKLRHNYIDSLIDHAKKVAGYPLGTADRALLDEQFQQKMEDDLAELKDQLGIAKKDAILSKESLALIGLAAVAAATVASGAALAAVPLAIAGAVQTSGVLASVGGPLLMAHKYSVTRKKVLREHPMAYLYEINRTWG
jgi:hypothetical protein